MKFVNLLLLALLMNAEAHAAFTENARRYMSPRDLFNVMAQKFPVLSDRKKLKDNGVEVSCYAIVASNENVIGAVNPAIGRAAVELPPPGFVRWIGSCGHKIVSAQIGDLFKQEKNERLWARFVAPEILAKYRDTTNATNPYRALEGITWNGLDPKLREAQLKFSVNEMIGPEAVIHDLGYAKSTKEVTDSLAQTVNGDGVFAVALHNILLGTMLREEFLSY